MQPLRVVGVATDGAGGEQGEHESWLSTEAGAREKGALLAIPKLGETLKVAEHPLSYPPRVQFGL